MRTMKTKSEPDKRTEDALAELSGIALCSGPGCYRQLKPGQGRQTDNGRMCFGCAGQAVTS